jgi:hypothetical protein
LRQIALFLLATIAAPARSQELRVGAAAVPITPPVGIPMAGYYSERGAKGVRFHMTDGTVGWNPGN